jgi:RNA polymerase sigma-70 factor, ECF subfamily
MEQEIRACLDQKRYREAFALLLPEYQNKVFRLAYGMLGDAALAEDTAQEVFIRIWKALEGYRGQSSLATWIYAITRNTCLTSLKKGASRKEVSMEEPGVESVVERLSVPPAAEKHAGIDVSALVAQLPEKHRQVLRLYYMEEKSYQEVSRLLDMPMGTVKVYLHRGRKELAEALARSKMEKGTA